MTDGSSIQRNIPKDAARYWEPRRIVYNLVLTAVAGTVVLRTWPHFRPAWTPSSLPPLLVLAAIANVLYSAAYLVEAVARGTESWRSRRWIVWVAGTLLAMLLEYYWIVDEIYPAVPI